MLYWKNKEEETRARIKTVFRGEKLAEELRKKGVPESTMELVMEWDEKELKRRQDLMRAKGEEHFANLDWNLIAKHIHTPEQRQVYETFRKQVHNGLTEDSVGILRYRYPDHYTQFYVENFVLKPSFKDEMVVKLGALVKKARSAYVKKLTLGVGVGVGLGLGLFSGWAARGAVTPMKGTKDAV